MSYSVMLVDDEEEVRQAIAKRIDWKAIGFEVVATAENGEEALELAERICPDVVMTDIQMPFMDGLTFCKRMKEHISGTKIVIFSGYDEFEYAKEAIKLEAEEYILKPIDSEELREVFVRIKERLDEELDRKRNVERLEKYYKQSIPLLKEQFLMGLLEGRFTSPEKIAAYEESYEMKFNASFYCAGIFVMNTKEQTTAAVSDENLLAVSMKQLIDEEMEKELPFRSINYLGTVILLAMLDKREQMPAFIQATDRICKLANKILKVEVTAGIGHAFEELPDLHQSYMEAQSAVEYRILLGTNQSIFIQDIEPKSEERFLLGEQELQTIVKEIKVGTDQSLTQAVGALTNHLKSTSVSMNQLQNVYTEITVEMIRLTRVYEIDMGEIEGLQNDFYDQMKHFNSLDAMEEWLLKVCMQLRGKIRAERTDATKVLVDRAKQYINENFRESDLSVEKLCAYLGLSATYFSTLFKRETGESFVVYLTRIRMEQALQLLNTTGEKAYIISEMVGYTEPNYFSYVFKKQYGVSPSKYRANQMEKNEK